MTKRPEEIEGSETRARDRGYFGMSIPDERRSLAVPAVVENLVRSYFTQSIEARTRCLKGEMKPADALNSVMEGAAEMQRIFYGQTSLYERAAFNAQDQLGAWLVANIMGGEARDAAQRLLVANFKQIAEAGDAMAAGTLNEEMMQMTVDLAIEATCAALLGVPIDTFVTMRDGDSTAG